MNRASIAVAVFAVGLAACSSSAPKTQSDLEDPAGWSTMLETGLAIAPVAGAQVVTGSTDAAIYFGEELDARLHTALPGTPITAPGVIYARLEEVGPNAHARLRSLRRRLVRDEDLDEGELAAISRDLDERFLLLVFLDEGAVDGVQRTKLDDYRTFNYSMGTHGYPTGELHGQAIGFLLDLQEATRVWRAEVEYQSENLATAEENTDRVIQETRTDAAIRLSEALALADRNR